MVMGFQFWKQTAALAAASFLALAIGGEALAWESTKVYYNNQGQLQYAVDSDANRIVDFSYAGYHRGERDIPDSSAISPVLNVSPVTGDNTTALQQALNTVAAWPLNANGIRGVVLLAAGDYPVHGTLRINASGVILKGAGFDDDPALNTVLRRPLLTTTNKNPVLVAGGNLSSNWSGGDTPQNRRDITSSIVSVGDRSFTVASTAGLAAGDNIIIKHPSTQAWIDSVGGGGTAGDPSWTVDSLPLVFNRYITGISGNTVTIDAPLTNKLNRSLSQSYLYKYDRAGLLTEIGVENLQITIDTASSTSENHAEDALVFNTVEDSWVNRVKVKHFVNKGIVLQTSSRVTVQNSYSVEPHSKDEGGRRYNFGVESGQLNLFVNNLAQQGRHSYFGNGATWDSGNVFLDNTAKDSYDVSEPHRKWGHGFLYDNHKELDLRGTNKIVLGLYNRGDYGTSHGWSAANSVLWNCDVGKGKAIIEHPPTAENYAIGCKGNISGTGGPFRSVIPTTTGFIEGTGQTQLSIPSLYRVQLAERLGYTYPAVADAFVRAGSFSATNYGSAASMELKNSDNSKYDRDIYLKLDYTGYSRGQIGKAYLMFYVDYSEPKQPLSFYGLANDNWSEDTITWDTAPSAAGAAVAGTVDVSATGWYSVDVTDYIKSQTDKMASFKVTDRSQANVLARISSKESTAYGKPFLVISPQ